MSQMTTQKNTFIDTLSVEQQQAMTLLKDNGFHDEDLNFIKLSLKKWNVDYVLSNYDNINLCLDYYTTQYCYNHAKSECSLSHSITFKQLANQQKLILANCVKNIIVKQDYKLQLKIYQDPKHSGKPASTQRKCTKSTKSSSKSEKSLSHKHNKNNNRSHNGKKNNNKGHCSQFVVFGNCVDGRHCKLEHKHTIGKLIFIEKNYKLGKKYCDAAINYASHIIGQIQMHGGNGGNDIIAAKQIYSQHLALSELYRFYAQMTQKLNGEKEQVIECFNRSLLHDNQNVLTLNDYAIYIDSITAANCNNHNNNNNNNDINDTVLGTNGIAWIQANFERAIWIISNGQTINIYNCHQVYRDTIAMILHVNYGNYLFHRLQRCDLAINHFDIGLSIVSKYMNHAYGSNTLYIHYYCWILFNTASTSFFIGDYHEAIEWYSVLINFLTNLNDNCKKTKNTNYDNCTKTYFANFFSSNLTLAEIEQQARDHIKHVRNVVQAYPQSEKPKSKTEQKIDDINGARRAIKREIEKEQTRMVNNINDRSREAEPAQGIKCSFRGVHCPADYSEEKMNGNERINANTRLSDLYENIDILDEMVYDGSGCAFIYDELSRMSLTQLEEFYNHILPVALNWCTHEFAHEIICYFLTLADNKLAIQFIENIVISNIEHLSLEKYGSRLVQSCLHRVKHDSNATKSILDEICNIFDLCIYDVFGRHIISKCFSEFNVKKLEKLIKKFYGNIRKFSSHPCTSRVVQKLIESLEPRERSMIVKEAMESLIELSTHPNGQYVVQKCLEYSPCTSSLRIKMIDLVFENILQLGKHKYGSTVVQLCYQCANDVQRDAVIEYISSDYSGTNHNLSYSHNLALLVFDYIGNCVLRTILQSSNKEQQLRLIKKMVPMRHELKKQHFGQPILTRIESFLKQHRTTCSHNRYQQ